MFAFVPTARNESYMRAGEVPYSDIKPDTLVWVDAEVFEPGGGPGAEGGGPGPQRTFWVVSGGLAVRQEAPTSVRFLVDTGTSTVLLAPPAGPTEASSESGGWLGELVALWLHVLIALVQAVVLLGYSCLKNVCSWRLPGRRSPAAIDNGRPAGLDAGLLYGFRRRLTVNEETAIMAAVIQVADETYLARETAGGRAAVLPAGGALRAFDFGLRGAGAGQQLVGADGGVAGGSAEGAAALVGVGPARGPGLGVAAGGAAAAQPVGAGAPGQAAAAPGAVAGLGPFAAPAAPEWVMTETTAAGDRGTVVALNGTERLGGDVGIMRTDKGWIGIRRVSLSLALYAGAEAGLDARLLGIALQSDGHRTRIQFRDAVAKFEQTLDMVNEIVVTLNDMYLGGSGHDDLPRRAAGEPLLAVHAEVHRELEDAVRRFGEPPMDLDGPGALAELRVSQAYHGEAVAIAPVGFDNVDRISLPAATTSPQTLEHLAGDVGRVIAKRLQDLLLPREQGLDRIRTEGPRRLYVDPNLRNPKLYQRVLRRLVDSNLVSFQLDCECSVGLFFVHKKNGDLRMILDGRYSSLRFGEADKVELASGGAFSQIAVDGDDPIAVAGVDIADAFYNILLPPWLQKYFGLPPVRAGDFNLSHVGEGTPVHPSQKEILRQDRCTGDTLRRVISHYTSRGLIRRGDVRVAQEAAREAKRRRREAREAEAQRARGVSVPPVVAGDMCSRPVPFTSHPLLAHIGGLSSDPEVQRFRDALPGPSDVATALYDPASRPLAFATASLQCERTGVSLETFHKHSVHLNCMVWLHDRLYRKMLVESCCRSSVAKALHVIDYVAYDETPLRLRQVDRTAEFALPDSFLKLLPSSQTSVPTKIMQTQRHWGILISKEVRGVTKYLMLYGRTPSADEIVIFIPPGVECDKEVLKEKMLGQLAKRFGKTLIETETDVFFNVISRC
ncbi:unnamed protein product [Prorocentrum cordatum]|uniref:Ubiquitinyl hydrolase 1 n=2 Tax=Prorocentrum cordatum TaxID=2364126 RepID=A0ABN9W330_9DINO|nr:unnamed protein product [Polarella glacialis]